MSSSLPRHTEPSRPRHLAAAANPQRIVIATAIAALLLSSLALLASASSRALANPIVLENRNPGTTAWQSPNFDSYANSLAELEAAEAAHERSLADSGASPKASTWQAASAIEGYMGRTSINKGEAITLHVSTTYPSYNVNVYRQGWYGGAGASLKYSASNLTGASYATPAPDTNGMVAANWPAALTIQTDASWTSGVYVAWLSPTSDSGVVKYAIFVVRDDAQAADILYPIATSTYQAYNAWGGKSLYDYNSTGGLRAAKVSYDRPYDHNDGLGLYMPGDYNMVRWLEKEGYNVTYATSEDIQANPSLMTGRKVFLSNFHDEYWSMTMRDNLTAWRDQGKDLAFFDANNIYWQIRYEPNSSGVANRIIVCYKNAVADPQSTSANPQLTTVLFRDPPVNMPENALLGTMFDNAFGYGEHQPWVVSNASHWIYQGTGLSNGDTIDKLVGYEFDRIYSNIGVTPPGLEVVATSPINFPNLNIVSTHHATVYTAPSGAIVFNAGTNYWSHMLLGTWIWPNDTRVEQMTRNVLNRMITGSGTPGATWTPTTPPTNTPTPSITPTLDPSSGTFYRGINLGGAAVTVDGNTWLGSSDTSYTTNGSAMSNQWLALSPSAAGGKASMLTDWVEHWAHNLVVSSVPNGTYDVYLYAVQTWDDPNAQAFTFAIEGQVAGGWTPGPGGSWVKLGPFRRTISDGTINVTTGGTAAFSGIEIWSVGGGAAPTATPTNTPVPATATNTPVPTTATSTSTATATSTSTATATRTNTPVPATATRTSTATATRTNTPVPATATRTRTATATRTSTATATRTSTATATRTSTATATRTPTLAPTSTAVPIGSQLISNNGFELSPLNANGWATSTSAGSPTYSWATDQRRSGTRSAKIVASNATGAFARSGTNVIRVTPGKVYSFSAWRRHSNVSGTGTSIVIEELNSAGAVIAGTTWTSSNGSGTTSWNNVSRTFTTNSQTTQVRITLRIIGSGTVWWDDISLIRTL